VPLGRARTQPEYHTRSHETRRNRLFLARHARAVPAAAQTPQAAPGATRWFDLQIFAVNTRYRIIEDSRGVVVSNHLQERTQLRARLKLDAKGRYAVNGGVFTGTTFTSGWNSTGVGPGLSSRITT